MEIQTDIGRPWATATDTVRPGGEVGREGEGAASAGCLRTAGRCTVVYVLVELGVIYRRYS